MITQLINNTGNAVKNQFVITEGSTKTFQSYDTTICKMAPFAPSAVIFLDPKWCYSQTTLKHLKTFLNISDSKAQILKDIKDKKYIIKNLN